MGAQLPPSGLTARNETPDDVSMLQSQLTSVQKQLSHFQKEFARHSATTGEAEMEMSDVEYNCHTSADRALRTFLMHSTSSNMKSADSKEIHTTCAL